MLTTVPYARERARVAVLAWVRGFAIRRMAAGFAVACMVLVPGLSRADDITYGYDAVGRLVSVSVPGATAFYDYDAAGNITAIRRQGSVSAIRGDDISHVTSEQASPR